MRKNILYWELRIEGGENKVIEREDHSDLRIENGERVKLGYIENDRIGKVKINAGTRMENEYDIFDPSWDSITLEIVLGKNRE